MMVDPFKDGFSLVELTQAINALPNMYGRINELGIFSWRGQTTPSVLIEKREGQLKLVATTPWDGVAPKNEMPKRDIRAFAIPHTPLEDVVLASEVVGVRAFGTDAQLETVLSRVNDKLQVMKNNIDQTMEWRKMGALKGLVLDADGKTVIADYFDSFGVTKKVVNLGLGTASTDVRNKCVEVVRHIEDNLNGEIMREVRALVSPEFFDSLVSHSSVKDAYRGYAEAAQRLGGDLRKGFTFGGITFEEYRAVVDGMRFIEAGKGHAFPLGTQSTFSTFGAPATFNETVNTVALPFYARQVNREFNDGVKLRVESNQLPLVTRPAVLVELTAS